MHRPFIRNSHASCSQGHARGHRSCFDDFVGRSRSLVFYNWQCGIAFCSAKQQYKCGINRSQTPLDITMKILLWRHRFPHFENWLNFVLISCFLKSYARKIIQHELIHVGYSWWILLFSHNRQCGVAFCSVRWQSGVNRSHTPLDVTIILLWRHIFPYLEIDN